MGARFEAKTDRIEALVAKGRLLHAEAVRTAFLAMIAAGVHAMRRHSEQRRRAHSFGTMNPHLMRDIGLTRTEVKAGRSTLREDLVPTPAKTAVVHVLPVRTRQPGEGEFGQAA